MDLYPTAFRSVMLALSLITLLMSVPWCLEDLSSNSSLSLSRSVNIISLSFTWGGIKLLRVSTEEV